MSTYTLLASGSNLSQLVSWLDTTFDATRSFERGPNASAPTVKPVGLLWNRTDLASPAIGDALMRWNGSAWTLFADPEYAQLNAGGTVTLAADLPMGAHKLVNMGDGAASGDSVHYGQVMLLSGDNPMAGNLDMDGNQIGNVAAPTHDGDAANRLYVQNQIPYTDFVTLDGSGNGAFPSAVGARPESFWMQPIKTGKYFVPKLVTGTAVGSSSDTVLEYDTAGGTWAVRTIGLTFSDSSPYVSFAGGAPLAGADIRFQANRFNAN